MEGSAKKMMNSAAFGQIIILIVYLPILSLVGIEGTREGLGDGPRHLHGRHAAVVSHQLPGTEHGHPTSSSSRSCASAQSAASPATR